MSVKASKVGRPEKRGLRSRTARSSPSSKSAGAAKAAIKSKSKKSALRQRSISEITPGELGGPVREAERDLFRMRREAIRARNPEMTEEQVEERLREVIDPEWNIIYPKGRCPLPGYQGNKK